VIRNAVNLEAFERKGTDVPMVRQQLGVQDYAMILGHVGRFSIEKNHVFLLDVLQELRAGGVDACLVLVGDGPLQGKIASDAEVLGLQAHVRFTGVRQDIPDLLRAFNVLLLPSFSEGMPNVVLESQSAGTPALVSDTITPEVDVGLGLVSYASITSVSSWVNRLLAMQQILRPSPGQIRSAIRHAGFDLASSVKTLVNVYDRTALC
jgi:glycosyltransferase involved in cell wall biosynthesis